MAYKYVDEKAKRAVKLSKSFQSELLGDLIQAFTLLKDPGDTAQFMTDLLTKSEVSMLSKRLRIAKLLLEGKTYQSIGQELDVSYGTVAKVAQWLEASGSGLKKVVSKLPKKQKAEAWADYGNLNKFKRSHPLYFWPELIIDRWGKEMDTAEKKRLEGILDKLSRKAHDDADIKEQNKERCHKLPSPIPASLA